MKIYGNIKIHDIERNVLCLLIFAILLNLVKWFVQKILRTQNGDFGFKHFHSTLISKLVTLFIDFLQIVIVMCL